MSTAAPRLVPPRIIPPAQPLKGLAFLAAFVRNPLEVAPQAVYEQDLVAGAIGRVQRLWITSPALVKTVLLDEREKFQKLSQIRLLAPLLGKGILTSEGAEWKWQRQASAPMFRHQDLLGFVPAFVHATEALMARWRAAPAGSAQAVDRDMTRATFDVISATLLPSADHATVEKSMGLFQRAGGWGQLYAMAGAPLWLPHPGMASGARATRMLRAAVAAMLRERRGVEEKTGGSPDDLMRRLTQARDPESGQSMNEERLIDNLLTFYLAGHETTARALAWTLYLVARSPEWGAALEEEIGRVTGGGPVGSAHIERLVLVQQVLQGIDAPVSAGAAAEPPVRRRHAPGRRRHRARRHRGDADLRDAPPCEALGGSRRLRPRALRAGARGENPALPVPAVRRRPAHLHRHGLRDDRGDGDAGDAAAEGALRAGAGARALSRGARHAAARRRPAAESHAALALLHCGFLNHERR